MTTETYMYEPAPINAGERAALEEGTNWVAEIATIANMLLEHPEYFSESTRTENLVAIQRYVAWAIQSK